MFTGVKFNAVNLISQTHEQKRASQASVAASFRDLLWVIPLAAIMFFVGLGSFGIIDPSDGLYAEGAREMLELGDFLTPYVNYMPFYEKPILIYWLIAAAYKVFGIHEWAARMPSAISGVALVISTFFFLRHIVGRRSALLATLVLMSTPLLLVVGHLALTDVPLTFLFSLTLFCLFRALLGGSVFFVIAAYESLALSVLLKGPVTILLAGLVLCTYICVSRSSKLGQSGLWWGRLALLRPIMGLAMIVVIAGPWYIVEILLTKGAFFQEFFVVQHMHRAAGIVNHQNPWFYYIPCFLVGMFPWSLYFLGFGRHWYRVWQKRELPVPRTQVSVFCLCWVGVIFIFFSLARAKLPTYILPTTPALAILIGLFLDTISRKSNRYLLALGLILNVCLTVFALVSLVIIAKLIQTQTQFVVFGVGILLGGLLLYLIAICQDKTCRAIGVFVAAMVTVNALLVPAVLKLYYKQHSQGLTQLLGIVKKKGGSLALFMRDSPAAYYYLRHKVPKIFDKPDLNNFKAQYPKPHLIMATHDVVNHILPTLGRLDLITSKGKWYLFAAD